MLIKAKQSWVVPVVAILGLVGYHNERKDKDFLLLQTKDVISLFRVEYLLIGFPFILIECLRNRFPEAGAIIDTSLLLPKLKTIKWKSIASPLPFLYKGVLEYSRMFRLYGWLYILLFLIALVGTLHGNIRIGKVALIVWEIIQAMAFTSIPQRQKLTSFLNYPTLQKKLIPTKKYSNPKQTPNFTFSGVKLGVCFVIP